MRLSMNVPFLVRGTIVALVVIVAGGVLLSPAGFRSGEQSAEAAFLGEVKKLIASDSQAKDEFGESVAISGDTAVVGAHREAGGAGDPLGFAGAAYVFQRDHGGSDNWGEVVKLTASDSEAGDQFGESVAISGDTVVVGALYENAGGAEAGAAYVFQRDEGGAGNWGEVAKLTASDAEAEDEFGDDVAVGGDIVFVGARLEDEGGDNDGAAYVFGRDEGGADNWGEVKKILASDAETRLFGRRVAVSGNTALVTAFFDGGSPAGTAYVLQRDEGGVDNWGEVTRLSGSDIELGDNFGKSVAVSVDTAIVGADSEDAGGQEAGAAYVFQRDEGGANNWGEVVKLTASDAETFDAFGFSVAIDVNTLVVGAFLESSAGNLAGAVYIFERDQGGADNWGEVNKHTASAIAEDLFGVSVSVSGDTTLVGARWDDEGTPIANSGAAYILGPTGPGDTDQDGCADKAENGPDENSGGLRDANYFWDFYDVWTHPSGQPTMWERDKVINIPGDILGVAGRFGPGPGPVSKAQALADALTPPVNTTGYHAAFDRGGIIGANNWDRAPADGTINIVDDILGVAAQFGHDCS